MIALAHPLEDDHIHPMGWRRPMRANADDQRRTTAMITDIARSTLDR
jgi:hypothetical protein